MIDPRSGQPPRPQRPNILFVTFDQWRADHVGTLGCPLPITPNVDRLARRGITLARHYAQCAPCGPSRASILTGRYAMNHRALLNGTPLDAGMANLATELRACGYDPQLIGYTDTPTDPRTVPADDPRLREWETPMTGFNVRALLPESQDLWVEWLRTKGYDYPDNFTALGVAGFEHPPNALRREPMPVPAELSPSAFITDAVLDAVRESSEAWAIHATYLSPHPPFVAPAPFHALIDPADVEAPRRRNSVTDEGAVHPLLSAILGVDTLRAAADERSIRELRAIYAGMVAEVDHQFGRLLDGLDAVGVTDNTLVVLTSDHGEQLGDHWLMHKLGYFAESYHVPCVISWPARGWATGRVEHAFTENIDLFPTILSAVGRTPPEGTDGANLEPILDGTTPASWRRHVHWEWAFRDPRHRLPESVFGLRHDQCSLAVVRDLHTHYVQFSGQSRGMPSLAFDLDADPDCFVDRAGDPGFATRTLAACQTLAEWQMAFRFGALDNHLITDDGLVVDPDPPR